MRTYLNLFLTICCVLCSILVHAQVLSGMVISVADGDTYTLLDSNNISYKIRLHGVDCPEKSQDFGKVAKLFAVQNLMHHQVTVKLTTKDRYGRFVGITYIDNTNFNELLLEKGLAWHYTQYDQNEYWQSLENKARAQKLGLWQQPNAMAPWLYRKNKKLHKSKTLGIKSH